MRSVYLAIAGAICIAVAGGYFYLDNRIESMAQQAITKFNMDPDTKVRIHVGKLEPGLLSHTVTLSDISFLSKANGAPLLHADSALLTTGDLMDPQASIVKAELVNLSAKNPVGTLSLGKLRIAGADLTAIYALAHRGGLDHWPLDLLEAENLDLDIKGATPLTFKLGQYRFTASHKGKQLDQFLVNKLNVGFPARRTDIALNHFEIEGGDLSLLMDLVHATQTAALLGENYQVARKVLAGRIARATLTYMGMNSIDLNGFSVSLPQSVGAGIRALKVSDIERHDGVVVGARMLLDDMAITNIGHASPQAAQIAALTDFNDFHLNAKAESHFEEKTRNLKGASQVKADRLFNLSYQTELKGVDVDQMAKAYQAFQERQLDRTLAGATPGDAMAAMVAQLIESYAGYYAGVDFTLDLQDQGLIERGLKLRSAMTRLAEDQLRAQLLAAATEKMTSLFGGKPPASMDGALKGYFTAPSAPIHVALHNTAPLSTEKLHALTPATWQQLFDINFTPQTGAQAAASR